MNKLSFGSAAYPDLICLGGDTFLQKIKNDYLAKKCVCVCVCGGGGGIVGAKAPAAPLVAPPLFEISNGFEFTLGVM